jgi:predicted DNA-binding transcriptional regulator AlpA
MTDQNIQTHCCNHYPNRVLQKRDLAVELGGVCEKTVDNLVKAGRLPKPCWLNSIPVWMLYDIHAFLSAQAGKPRTGDAQTETAAKSSGPKTTQTTQTTKGAAHKAGKYSA